MMLCGFSMSNKLIPALFYYILVGLCLLLESITDIRKREINLPATAVLVLVGGVRFISVCRTCIMSEMYRPMQLLTLCVPIVPGILFMILSIISRGAIGLGDGIVITLLGLLLSSEQIMLSLMISFILCGMFSFFCLFVMKKEGKYEVPYLPFLSIGYIGGVILGYASNSI